MVGMSQCLGALNHAYRIGQAFASPIPKGQIITNLAQVNEVITRFGYHITVKAVGVDLAHKTELGAVKLNLNSCAEVEQADKTLLALSDTLLVEQMVKGAVVELILVVADLPDLPS